MSETPHNLGRLVCYGSMPGGEIWASGFWMSFDGAPANGTEWQVIVEAVGSAMFAETSWFKPQNVAATKWLGVKGYWHAGNPGANAVYAADGVFGSAVGGSGSGQEQPNQIAMVATLQTGQSGRSYRGRMYVPATNLAISNGFIGSSQVDAVANGLADLLIAAATAGVAAVEVVSTTLNVQTPAIAVRVTDKPDTQRRRANRLGPTYQQIAGLV